MASNGSADLLPLTAARSFLARQEARLPPPSAALRPYGCKPAGPSPDDRHRGRMGRPEQQSGDTTMAQIGTFTRGDDGVVTGTIRTLNINTKATIKPVAKNTGRSGRQARQGVRSLRGMGLGRQVKAKGFHD
jgi:hypothetical protein